MNLFLVKDGELITPSHTDNILEGITRNFLVRLAKEELGMNVSSRRVSRTELYTVNEAFFCGTGAQIAPIGTIDHYDIGSGKPGTVTKQLQKLHYDVCLAKNSKYLDQVLPVGS